MEVHNTHLAKIFTSKLHESVASTQLQIVLNQIHLSWLIVCNLDTSLMKLPLVFFKVCGSALEYSSGLFFRPLYSYYLLWFHLGLLPCVYLFPFFAAWLLPSAKLGLRPQISCLLRHGKSNRSILGSSGIHYRPTHVLMHPKQLHAAFLSFLITSSSCLFHGNLLSKVKLRYLDSILQLIFCPSIIMVLRSY